MENNRLKNSFMSVDPNTLKNQCVEVILKNFSLFKVEKLPSLPNELALCFKTALCHMIKKKNFLDPQIVSKYYQNQRDEEILKEYPFDFEALEELLLGEELSIEDKNYVLPELYQLLKVSYELRKYYESCKKECLALDENIESEKAIKLNAIKMMQLIEKIKFFESLSKVLRKAFGLPGVFYEYIDNFSYFEDDDAGVRELALISVLMGHFGQHPALFNEQLEVIYSLLNNTTQQPFFLKDMIFVPIEETVNLIYRDAPKDPNDWYMHHDIIRFLEIASKGEDPQDDSFRKAIIAEKKILLEDKELQWWAANILPRESAILKKNTYLKPP